MPERLHSLLYYAPQPFSPALPEYEALPSESAPIYLIGTHPVYLPSRFARSQRVLLDLQGYHPQHREVLLQGAVLLAPESNHELAAYLHPGEEYYAFTPGQLAQALQALDADPELEAWLKTAALRRRLPMVSACPDFNLRRLQDSPAIDEMRPLYSLCDQLLAWRQREQSGLVLHLLNELRHQIATLSEPLLESVVQYLCQIHEPLGSALQLWFTPSESLQLLLYGYESEALSQLTRWEVLLKTVTRALKQFPTWSPLYRARLQALQHLKPQADLSQDWAQAVRACPLEMDFWKGWLSSLLPHAPEQALYVIQQAKALNSRHISELAQLEYFYACERRLWVLYPAWNPEIPRARYVLWEGEIQAHNSLARINRYLTQGLTADPDLYLTVLPFLDPEFKETEPLGDDKNHVQFPDVFVSHRWPPRLDPPQQGRWVNILPWEHGAIPAVWLPVLNTQLDQIWVPSAFIARCMQQSGVDHRLLRIIPNGVDLTLYSPTGPPWPLPGGPNCLRFLFVGGLLPVKGVDILLQAYAQAFTRADPVQLVIKGVGTADLYSKNSFTAYLQAFITDPRLPDLHIITRSDFSEAEVASLYRACDVYVHPYRGEGFGLPILEAMACGLPVVVPDAGPALEFTTIESAWYIPTWTRFVESGDVPEIERPHYTPFYHEPDIQALVELLRQIAMHPEQIRSKGRAARQQAEAFSWKTMVERVQREIQTLVAGPPPRRSKTQDLSHWLQRLKEALSSHALDFRHVLAQALEQGVTLDILKNSDLDVQPLPPLRLGWPSLSDPLLTCLPFQPDPASFSPSAQFLRIACHESSEIHWLLDYPPKLPKPGSCQVVWYAQPEVFAKLKCLGWPDDCLLYLPHAVDFQRYSPEGPVLELKEAKGRHVFLSCPDFSQDDTWRQLLSAYIQTFTEADSVLLVLHPQGMDFEVATEQVLCWLQHMGCDPERMAALILLQETLDTESLPALLRAANTWIELQSGPCLLALAAQASGLRVIARAQQPYLQRPFAEFWNGSLTHLRWLLRQAFIRHTDQVSLRTWLQDEYDLPCWRKRVKNWLENWRLRKYWLEK